MDNADLVYAPARRGGVGVLLMIAGPSGSGKTLSALKVAVGLANGGPIYFLDTEHSRALYYADDFTFQHLPLQEPFTPKRFEAAAVVAQKAGAAVLIIDSFSHEHTGPGGVLDMQEAELTRLTRGDESKRDNLKYSSWIVPKMEHKHMLQRLWQLNTHMILCCHGEKKLDLIKDKRTGKMVPNPDATISPVCNPDIVGAMTASFLLDPKQPGVPKWLKRLNKIEGLVDLTRPLNEETGARIAAWANGTKVEPVKTDAATDAYDDQPPDDTTGEPGTSPVDQPAGPDPKMLAYVDSLVERFLGTADLKEHHAIVADKATMERINWLKRREKAVYAQRLKPAIDASWKRNNIDPPGTDPVRLPDTDTAETKPAEEELPL